MRYSIIHSTTYTYDRPVLLSPHVIRLRPRCDVAQRLHQFSWVFHPEPQQVSENIDLDGNAILKAWFIDQPVTEFRIQAYSEVETYRTNPFIFLLEPWAVQLPIDYPASLLHQLRPYLQGQVSHLTETIDPTAMELAQEIWQATAGNTVAFLSELNQKIYQHSDYTLRETGAPFLPGITWRQKSGACRDVAVLFIEACRAVGLAARFVSGYQEGDPDQDDRHLHAWAEVYLPGAGWRGYDPTHGMAVADRHIALVAAPAAHLAAPISGSLKTGGAQSHMKYQLKLQALG